MQQKVILILFMAQVLLSLQEIYVACLVIWRSFYISITFLFHTVYPFFGEGERRSFSANISLTSDKIMSVKKVANAEIRAAKKFS